MKLLSFMLLFAMFTLSATSGLPQNTVPSSLQMYEKVWNEQNSNSRLTMINTIWLGETTYEDPAALTKGPIEFNAMITKFHKDFPGSTLTAAELQSTKNKFYTWTWKVFDASKKLIMTGRDIIELNGDGKILAVKGFFGQASTVPDSEENKNLVVVSTYYNYLFKTRDFNSLPTLIEEGAIYYQAAGLPYGGEYIGFSNWVKMFTHVSGLVDLEIEKEPTYLTDPTTAHVILRFTVKFTSKKSGKKISMPIAEHFEVKNGKIISIRPFYFDTLKFAEFLR